MSNVEQDDRNEVNTGALAPNNPITQPPDNLTTQSPNNPTSQSRRDFLRRAGTQAVKEAVAIGSKVVPGGALVRQFVESADARDPDEMEDDLLAIRPKPAPTTILKNPLNWFAAWRKGRQGSDE